MTTLSKDEVVRLAREVGYRADAKMHDHDYDLFLNFYTLCRAPLVAEVERLKKDLSTCDKHIVALSCIAMEDVHELLALQADRDDWKARAEAAEAELARVRAGKPVAYIAWKNDKPCYEGDDAICEDAVWPVDSDDDRTSMPVCTAPQPAAQEPTSAVPVVGQLVEALDGLFSGDVVVWSLGGSARPRAAITAGQKFIKENGK